MAVKKAPATKRIKKQIKSLKKADLKLNKEVKDNTAKTAVKTKKIAKETAKVKEKTQKVEAKTERVAAKTQRVAVKTKKLDSEVDKLKKDLDALKAKKSPGKKHSAYNLFIGSQLKQGKTFKQAVEAWKNRNKVKTKTRTVTKIVQSKPKIKYRTKTVTKLVKADKKPHSAYNLFIGAEMKEGKTFKQAVQDWKNRNKKPRTRTKTVTKIIRTRPKVVTKVVRSRPKIVTKTVTKVVRAKPKIVTKTIPGKTQIKYRTRIVKEKVPTTVKAFDEDSFFKKFTESLTQSFSKFNEKIGERFDVVENRISSLEEKVSSLESRPSELESAVINAIDEKQDGLLRKLDELIFVLSQQPIQKQVSEKTEEKSKTSEETVVLKVSKSNLLDKATPEEKILAYNIVETYFEDVARLGLKRSLTLDEVIETYKNTLSEVKAKNEQIKPIEKTELEKAIVRTSTTTVKEGEQ